MLARLRRRLRKTFIFDGVVTLLLGVILALAASFVLDYFVRLPLEVRGILLLAGVVAAGREAYRRVYRPLSIQLRDEELAILLERAHPDLRDSLLTAVELTRDRNDNARYTSRDLLDAVVAGVEQRVSKLGFQKVFDLRRVHQKFVGVILLVLGVFVACRVDPELASIWAQRNLLLSNVNWPKVVHLQLMLPEPGPIVVAVGDDLPVAVRAERGEPSMVVVRSVATAGRVGAERVDTMAQSTDGLFHKTFTNVARPFEFSVEGGDDQLGPFSVRVRLRPRIDMQSVRLWFDYPEYLGLAATPADEPVRFPNVKVPVGTRVRFSMESNVDVENVYLSLGFREDRSLVSGSLGVPESTGESRESSTTEAEAEWPPRDSVALEVEGRRAFSGEFTVKASGHYYFQLETADGFRSQRPDRFRIEAIPDHPPDVRVVLPERLTEEVTPNAKVEVLVRGADDHGVEKGSVEGSYFAPGSDEGKAHSMALEVSAENVDSPGEPDEAAGSSSFRSRSRERRCLGRTILDVASLASGVAPGARFQFYVQLRDVGGNIGESDVYYLRVVEPEELAQVLNNRLMVVRDRLIELRRQQQSARKDVETFQEEVSLKGQLSSGESHRVFRFERDQGRIREGLERERDATARILQRAVNNNVGDERWRDWVQGVRSELGSLASEKAAGIETALREIKTAADREPQEPRELQRVLSRQIDLEDDIEMLVLQLSEYGDINALIQRLRDIRKAQTDLRDETQSVLEDASLPRRYHRGGVSNVR